MIKQNRGLKQQRYDNIMLLDTIPNKKQQYRSAVQITHKVLSVIVNGGREGVSVSVIARAAGIGHKSLVEKCQKLIDAGMLREETGHKSRRYYITEEGIHFQGLLVKYEELFQTIFGK